VYCSHNAEETLCQLHSFACFVLKDTAQPGQATAGTTGDARQQINEAAVETMR
jgi:hypothetical protein